VDRIFQIVSVIALLMIHGPTECLIEVELLQHLVGALMRWTLGSELTSIPIERKMHEMIMYGVGFLGKKTGVRAFNPEVNDPVYISEPLVVLSLSSIFEEVSWTTKKAWMAASLYNVPNSLSQAFALENVFLLVLVEIFGEKFSDLADAFECSESLLGSRKETLVSLKRVAGGEMQSCPDRGNRAVPIAGFQG
jgi:hypothetical protein